MNLQIDNLTLYYFTMGLLAVAVAIVYFAIRHGNRHK